MPSVVTSFRLYVPAGAAGAFGPLYFATFCALSVTLGALLYNLTGVLNEYFEIQQRLTSKPEVCVDLCQGEAAPA
jgi:hypothetical protein